MSNGKKKKAKAKSAFQPLKNPCLALNELRPGLEYKLLEQTGPVHQPTFKIAIDLDGQIFTGEGRYAVIFAFQFYCYVFDLQKVHFTSGENPFSLLENTFETLYLLWTLTQILL